MKAIRVITFLAGAVALALATGCGGGEEATNLAPLVRGVTAETRSVSAPGAKTVATPAADQIWVIPIYIEAIEAV